MGGLNSEINPQTTSVVIESACFERFGIRRTSKAMGLSTEASYRFERGVDPVGSLWTAHRAAELIQKLAGGKIISGHIDVYPTPIERAPVRGSTGQGEQPSGNIIIDKTNCFLFKPVRYRNGTNG